MLGSGSGDIVPMIFSYVTSLKEKVQLERVCRSFRKNARTFQAWSNIIYVKIREDDFLIDHNNYWINNDNIAVHHLPSAIESILHRSRNVRFITTWSCKRLTASALVCRSVIDCGTNQKIQELRLNGCHSPDISANILLLVEALKNQLKCLTLAAICFEYFIEMDRLWENIGECGKLESFAYMTGTNCDHWSTRPTVSPEMVKVALRGKAINTIGLWMPCIDTVNFIDIVSSFSDPRSLRYLMCSNWLSLADFALSLPFTFDNLNQIDFIHAGSLTKTNRNWSAILRLPLLSSQLKALLIKHDGPGLDRDQVVELIASYLTFLNKRPSAVDFKIRLYSKAFVDTDWSTVKESLVKNHDCQIEEPSFSESNFCVRCGKSSCSVRASVEI
jgi:hypothetical protein